MKILLTTVLFLFASVSIAQEWQWEKLQTKGAPTARHEAAFVAYKGKGYLIGGRRINPVDVFDPATNTWTAESETPIELHHFQAVVIDDAIYLIGAMTGPWPKETPLEKIIVYYPERDEFRFVHSIPESRRRGGAGAVLHNGKIYVVGGITNGHMDGYQPWLDVYDPKTGDWQPLADARHARDHFQSAIVGDKIYAVAGRTTSQRTRQGFDLTVKAVDVYDLELKKWLGPDACPDIPTPRAGNMAVSHGSRLIVGGGESGTQNVAHNEVEAFDVTTRTWSKWPALGRGRHGSGFAILGDYVYTASGSGNRGGGPELTTVERLKLPSSEGDEAIVEPTTMQWHTKTLSFHGPQTSESADTNPFTDYRLSVTFEHPEVSYTVRGFYSADGNAAETSADSGNVWQARFSPDRPGVWKYSASLRTGKDIAIDDDPTTGTNIEIADARGTFEVVPTDAGALGGDPAANDFRNRGRLIADSRYMRFGEDGAHWLKGGADSPENLLAFADFDGSYRISTETTDGEAKATEELHRYAPHLRDWSSGDPIWKDGKGKGLIGAINYLASTGMNAVYFLTMNIGGDGKDVWPYATPDDFTRFDCSKLDQWEIVFEHMQSQGILMQVVTQETENERMLDDGDTGRLRKLYYNELIARFAHHPALVWNLGEENGPADFSPNGQTAVQQKAMANYLKKADPYNHPVVIHTHSTAKGKEEVITDLLGCKSLDGLSFQVDDPKRVRSEIQHWHQLSEKANRPWLIAMDEIGPWHTGTVPDSDDPNHDSLRRHVLWGSLLAGASGVEWYFGAKFPHNDLTSEDWRQRENVWKQTRHALDFFMHIPYWEMRANDFAFEKPGEVVVLYVPAGSKQQGLNVDLTSFATDVTVHWFDPRNGGELQQGTVQRTKPSKRTNIGFPPNTTDADWVVLIQQ